MVVGALLTWSNSKERGAMRTTGGAATIDLNWPTWLLRATAARLKPASVGVCTSNSLLVHVSLYRLSSRLRGGPSLTANKIGAFQVYIIHHF